MTVTRRHWIGSVLAGVSAWLLTWLVPAPADAQTKYGRIGKNIPKAGGVIPPGNVLQSTDLTYQGFVTMPTDISLNFPFSSAALSGRVVGGDIHLFINQASPDQNVAEVKYNGAGNRASLITDWGDVTKGKRACSAGTGSTYGLFWDDVAGQLWTSYGYYYNVAGAHDPSIITSTLTGSSNAGVTAYGPWRTSELSQRTKGYMLALPSSIQTALGGGQRFASGAPITSGNATTPWGAFATAWAPPANATPPDIPDDSHVTINCTSLIYTDFSNPQTRTNDVDNCNWTHYGEVNGEGHTPEDNPTQNGSGCTVDGDLCGVDLTTFAAATFLSLDMFSAVSFVTGSIKSGFVYIGQLSRTIAGQVYAGTPRCHRWYGPTQGSGLHLCPHGQNDATSTGTGDGTSTQLSALYIYDPADLRAVALGTKTAIQIASTPNTNCADLSAVPTVGGSVPQLATQFYNYGGAWFEPTNKLLFVSQILADDDGHGHNTVPVVHVFSVNC